MARRVAITGANGQLGRQLVAAFSAAADDVLPLARPEFDITEASHLARLQAWRPDVVVNAAAWTDVDGCAGDPERALAVNGEAAGAVARAGAGVEALVVQVSTNEVFDGELKRPYLEDDAPNPINAYGTSKLAGERSVMDATDRHLVIRTAWLFGPGAANFVTRILAAADRARQSGQPLRVVSDEWGNPTPAGELAAAVVAAVDAGERGIRHVAGQPPTSRHGWAVRILADQAVEVEPTSRSSHVRASVPPPRAVLGTRHPLREIAWGPASDALVAALAAGRAAVAGRVTAG